MNAWIVSAKYLDFLSQIWLPYCCFSSKLDKIIPFTEHTRDKQIQRDDEYYDGDNDNDHNVEDV